MASLGAKTEIVNAQAVKIQFGGGPDDFILAIRKDLDYRSPQRRIPTGAGPIYFTMLPDNRMQLTFAWTTGEVGNSVAANWDEMIKRNATTKEVPENVWKLAFTDAQGSPTTKTFTHTCKVTRFHSFAAGEGETMAELELQIIDDDPAVT